MKIALLVPGIMGTRLELEGDEIWPPTPIEMKSRYHRIDKLLSDGVKPTEIIYSILSFQLYGSIREQLVALGYKIDGAASRYVDFPYDWRRDLFDTAKLLANRLTALHNEGAAEIALFGHSMGGLICRLLLESGEFNDAPWFSKINLFVALAVPHLGAPLALARIFGLDSALGINGKDFAKLARNPKYPSGYQLIPAPGEDAIWDLDSDHLRPLDPYHPNTIARLDLVPELVARARAVHDVLGKHNMPPGVRYFYFAGVGHKSVTRVNVKLGLRDKVDHSDSVVTHTPDSGDGTVPVYSALPRIGQRQLVVNEHATVFTGTPFKRVLARLLGGDAGPPTEVLRGTAMQTILGLSINSPVQHVGQPIEVTLNLILTSVPAEMAASGESDSTSFEGKLVLDLVDETGQFKQRHFRETPIAYAGPGIDRITAHIPAIDAPGLFLLRFTGTLQADNDVRFVVSAQ